MEYIVSITLEKTFDRNPRVMKKYSKVFEDEKDATTTYEALLTALNTLEAFSE